MSATSTADRDNGGASARHLQQKVERAGHLKPPSSASKTGRSWSTRNSWRPSSACRRSCSRLRCVGGLSIAWPSGASTMASLDNAVVIDSERQPRDRCRGQCRTLGEDDRSPTHARARAFLARWRRPRRRTARSSPCSPSTRRGGLAAPLPPLYSCFSRPSRLLAENHEGLVVFDHL